MTVPRVSMIITCFNEEEYIGQTVANALAQTYQDLEVIVVDDGSTDQTRAILEGFEDNRLRVVQQNNAGTFAARNRGLAESKGDYIVIHDADDLMALSRVEHQVAFLETHADVHGVGTQVAVFMDGMSRAVPLWCYPTDAERLNSLLCQRFSARPFICFASFMFRATAMRERMPFYPSDVRLSGDWIAFRKHATDGLRLANLDTAEYFFRVSGDTAQLRKNIIQYRYVRYYNRFGKGQDPEMSLEEFKARPKLVSWHLRAAWDMATIWNWLKFKGRLLQVRIWAALGKGILLPHFPSVTQVSADI